MKTALENQLKILYAVQCTGNGHTARSREIIPILQKYGSVDVILSGDQGEVPLPIKPKFWNRGLTFIYNKDGGVSMRKTMLHNNFFRILKEVRQFPIDEYDLVINDFDFISAWACKLRKKPCYGLGHQVAYLSAKTPRPHKRSWLGEMILKYYAPLSQGVGFHFDHFDEFIHKPVIRSEIRQKKVSDKGHYTAYLPAFSDENIYHFLSKHSSHKWEVFSRNIKKPYSTGNISFYPISNEAFIQSLVSCTGIFTSAGFETPAEALYLGKKVLVIPIKSQYEQYCNAAAMQKLGIPVIFELNDEGQRCFKEWMLYGQPLKLEYPDVTEEVIYKNIIQPHLTERVGSVHTQMAIKAVKF